jgi:hypothetical protein
MVSHDERAVVAEGPRGLKASQWEKRETYASSALIHIHLLLPAKNCALTDAGYA